MGQKNVPKYVLFEPNYVGWGGLVHAVADAKQLGVPLAVAPEFYTITQRKLRQLHVNINVIRVAGIKRKRGD